MTDMASAKFLTQPFLIPLGKPLHSVTLWYLGLPYLIFFAGWLKVHYAIALAVVWLLAQYFATLKSPGPSKERTYKSPQVWVYGRSWEILFILLVLFAWLSISGVGQFGFQNGDYFKHNALLKDLTFMHWPTSYLGNYTGRDEVLGGMKDLYFIVYGVAYYLPAALIGKILGMGYESQAIFAWTLIGEILVIGWVVVLAKRLRWWLVLFFIFFSGMDVLGGMLVGTKPNEFHHEWWSTQWQYSSVMTLILWVPQHQLAGHLCGGILLSNFLNKRTGDSVWAWSLSILWSPFIGLALAPFLLFQGIREKFRGLMSFPNAVGGGVVVAICCLYLSTNINQHPHHWVWHPTLYLHFIVIEFLLLGVLLFLFTRKNKGPFLWVLLFSTLMLIITPFYKMGIYNDLCMRASIPYIFFYLVYTYRYLTLRKRKYLLKNGCIAALFLFGALTGVNELRRTVKYWPNKMPVVSMNDFTPFFSRQYFGHVDSVFFRYLAKDPSRPRNINTKLEYVLRQQRGLVK